MKLFLRMSMLVLLLIPLTSGCARDRNQSGISTETSGFSSAEEGAKKELELLIKNHIQTSKTYNDAAQVPVVYRRPYYLKEYSVYFNGPDAFDIAYRELESKTRPLMAEVTIEKVRFSTKMHRKKNLAREDHEFVRDTGVEKMVYELHNGRWTRIGAIFDAKTTEEQVNGEWVPKREELERVLPEEQQPGWFGRLWNRIRGEE
ncbi:MAG TPA: hypothetical protein PLQ42_00115 [Candidatus Hydrogenedentes bacterium]|jgi:hypothetical protein|nr:hypothetical protein [Candidatus Hydrogenedentota bacterium]HOM48734.1 hypothetical protein [Candidatus Hydrogenedentota bacterium]HOR49462.1 hypothetical protein [Candidatus Hydrogenedentota bacterium]HPK24398.1 hypothetical protein [Candidatus Hydrogenedentota bacterium]HPX85457.1 hypothetical protein [Candidatus Hydrogenedentota bacterium]